jgi:hypothetical protein
MRRSPSLRGDKRRPQSAPSPYVDPSLRPECANSGHSDTALSRRRRGHLLMRARCWSSTAAGPALASARGTAALSRIAAFERWRPGRPKPPARNCPGSRERRSRVWRCRRHHSAIRKEAWRDRLARRPLTEDELRSKSPRSEKMGQNSTRLNCRRASGTRSSRGSRKDDGRQRNCPCRSALRLTVHLRP